MASGDGPSAAMELAHRDIDTPGDDHLDRVGGLGHRGVEQVALTARDPSQHVAGTVFLVGGLADPDPNPQIVLRLEVLSDAAQAVVAGQAARRP